MNPTSPVANAARETLKEMGPKAIPYLVEAIYKTDNGRLFNGAIDMLCAFVYEPQMLKERIVYYFAVESRSYTGLESKDKKAFEKLSQTGPIAIPFLLRVSQMQGVGSYADVYAMGALGSLGAQGRWVVPELEKVFKEGKVNWHKEDFYSAVSKLGGQKAFDILVEELLNGGGEFYTKMSIMMDLESGDYGVSNERVVDAIKQMTMEEDNKVRISAYFVLSSKTLFQIPGADQIVLAGLDDPDNLVKYNVANFLGSKGPRAALALPKLKQLIDDPTTVEDFGGLNLSEALKEAYGKIKDSPDQAEGR
jgi:hypothetical protein